MMSLYDINDALEIAFYESCDPETGEITGDTTKLDELLLARDEKIENLALFIKNCKAEAEMIRAEEKKLADRRRVCENRAEWLKKYLANKLHGEKFKTARTSMSWRKSQAVEVEDIKQLPPEYLRFKEPEADKIKLKEDLKKGIEIDGAELVDNLSMIIK